MSSFPIFRPFSVKVNFNLSLILAGILLLSLSMYPMETYCLLLEGFDKRKQRANLLLPMEITILKLVSFLTTIRFFFESQELLIIMSTSTWGYTLPFRNSFEWIFLVSIFLSSNAKLKSSVVSFEISDTVCTIRFWP